MKIDVVLPTYNRCDLLPRAIDSFLAATVPDGATATLIVVDNNSKDDTKVVVEDYINRYPGRIQYLFEAMQGKHYALNTSIRQSSAEIIALFDDDEVVERNWLLVIARNFAIAEVDYVGGEVRPDWQAAVPAWFPTGYTGVIGIVQNGIQRRQYSSVGFKAMLPGGNSAIRRRVLEQCGPYSSDFMYAEDRYMFMQLGRIGAIGYYDPELIVLHSVPLKRLTKTYYRHWAFTEGRTNAKVARGMLAKAPSLWNVPLWMWRRTAGSLKDVVVQLGKSQRGKRFQSELQLFEFWGYISTLIFNATETYKDRTVFR